MLMVRRWVLGGCQFGANSLVCMSNRLLDNTPKQNILVTKKHMGAKDQSKCRETASACDISLPHAPPHMTQKQKFPQKNRGRRRNADLLETLNRTERAQYNMFS